MPEMTPGLIAGAYADAYDHKECAAAIRAYGDQRYREGLERACREVNESVLKPYAAMYQPTTGIENCLHIIRRLMEGGGGR